MDGDCLTPFRRPLPPTNSFPTIHGRHDEALAYHLLIKIVPRLTADL